MNSDDRPGSKSRTVEHLANDLMLAQEVRPERDPAARRGRIGERPGKRGRAIFLVGAGCSYSAGIPLAPEIARVAVTVLRDRYLTQPARAEAGKEAKSISGTKAPADCAEDPKAALADLIKAGKVPSQYQRADGDGDWEALYPYLFAEHLKHPNHQREIIGSLAGRHGALNWAHACLGELVTRKYVHTVLTTNFDQLVLQGIIRTGLIPVVADGLESLSRIDPSPSTPQVVHLHGSMHTYDLRNSPRAVRETSSDDNLKSTMHGLLRQATVLVIVGYRGGEEGIMDLIQSAADSFERMVIYWVAFEKDHRNLSARARRLIASGENTFFIVDQDADIFFQRLLREMKIGQPSWIEDPVKTLKADSAELKAVPDDEIRTLVKEYQDRINFADEHRADTDDRLIKALQARSRGAFAEAIELLEEIAGGHDLRPRRLLAQSWRDKFYDNEGSDLPDIRSAIDGFEALVNSADNPQRFSDVCSYIDAVWDLHDRCASSPLSDTDVERLRGVLEVIGRELQRGKLATQKRARLLLYKARVSQELSEKVKEGQGDSGLRHDVLAAYGEARDALKTESDDRAREAAEGLAGALIADSEFELKKGETLGDDERATLREKIGNAIQMHVELAEFAWYNASARDWAGSLSNLATAYLQLSVLERGQADAVYENSLRQAAATLLDAVSGYIEAGEDELAAQESARLSEVQHEIGDGK